MRTNIDFNYDWRFCLQDDAPIPFTASTADFDDTTWETVSLPHDWSILGDFDPTRIGGDKYGYLPAGLGWYRKTFTITDDHQQVRIHFDGVYRNSDVWINGVHLGHRPNGNVAFSYDIEQHLKPGTNVIAVRVDNRRQPGARWYTGSGIHRPVRLEYLNQYHIDNLRIETISLTKDQAEIDVHADVILPANLTSKECVDIRIRDPDSNIVAQGKPGRITIAKPQRWAPETPTLYSCEATLTSQDETDHYVLRFGLRTAELTGDRGFILNGIPTKFKGFCLHEDAGPLGTAVPETIWRHKLQLLKTMGCNALRVGHHPFPKVFYDLCDELGFLVMDEFFDGWDEPKAAEDYGHDFHRWWKRDVADTIKHNRHHPCIVCWSIGNEVHGVSEEKAAEICQWIKQCDSSRPVTMGRGYQSALDAAGFNGHGEKPGVLESYHQTQPAKPIILTEEPHLYSTRGFYRTLGWVRNTGVDHFPIPDLTDKEIFIDGDERYASSYDNCSSRITLQDCWKRTGETAWIAGQFHWTAFEYYGECEYHGAAAGQSISRYGNRGVIDAALIPKDHYYYYQSQWTDKPMVHILPHWTHPDLTLGTEIPIHAYSNADEVELLCNNTSLGRQALTEHARGEWLVPWQPGSLCAIAYRDGHEVARCEYHTAGPATNLTITLDNPTLTDYSRAELTAVDRHGTPVPVADSKVHIGIRGAVTFLGGENGDRLDLTPLRSRHRRLFYGQSACWLGRNTLNKTIKTESENQDFDILAAAIHGERLFRCQTSVAISLTSMQHNNHYDIFFTSDGSQPSPQSTRYDGPITIASDTHIRAVVMDHEEVIFELDEQFTRGEKEPVILRGHGVGSDQLLDGVRDAEAIGLWRGGRTLFRFADDGSVYEINASGVPDKCGQWWYDYPNDLDENPEDMGTGELRWLGKKRLKLEMTSREATAIKVYPENGKPWLLEREEENQEEHQEENQAENQANDINDLQTISNSP